MFLFAQKKKDLTAAEGHVVLLEYLEEQPLLLARPGMCTHSDCLPGPCSTKSMC